MKTLFKYDGNYGILFFDGDTLVQYLHQNDAGYSKEYHEPLLAWAGAKVVEIDKLNKAQSSIARKYLEE